jgi:DNA-binding IclR family transcriptional regulator
MTATKHRNQAQQRVLRTLFILIERGEAGALPGEIANAVGTIPSNATRDLANLQLCGFARTANGRWYAVIPPAAGAGASSSAKPRRRAGERNRKLPSPRPETVR